MSRRSPPELPSPRGPGCTRRRLLGAGLAAAATAAIASITGPSRRAEAIGPASKFRLGDLVLGTSTGARPTALKRLGRELGKRTAIDVEEEPVKVTLASPNLHDTPFLYLAGERELEFPGAAGIEALRRFLSFGGFLLVDSTEASPGGPFDRSVRALLRIVMPGPKEGLELVKDDHVIYKSFYLLDRPYGRVLVAPALEGITYDGRLVAAYVGNDLGGAWARDDLNLYPFPCEPGGERQREMAYRMGVNLVMYALCLDYKTDRVHVPFIMKRRQWKTNDGSTAPPPAPPVAPSK